LKSVECQNFKNLTGFWGWWHFLPCFIESNRIVLGYHLTDRFREGKGMCLHSRRAI